MYNIEYWLYTYMYISLGEMKNQRQKKGKWNSWRFKFWMISPDPMQGKYPVLSVSGRRAWAWKRYCCEDESLVGDPGSGGGGESS